MSECRLGLGFQPDLPGQTWSETSERCQDGRSCCRAVRRLLIAAVVLLASPVQAVDYVKCDAIQKAYTRVAVQQQEAGKVAYEAKQQELCGFDYGCRIKQEKDVMVNHAKAYEARMATENSFKDKLDKIKADHQKLDCP